MSSGVQFDEDNFSRAAIARSAASAGSSSSNQSGMVRWLMAHGIKSPAVANAILIGAIALNIIITIVVVLYFL